MGGESAFFFFVFLSLAKFMFFLFCKFLQFLGGWLWIACLLVNSLSLARLQLNLVLGGEVSATGVVQPQLDVMFACWCFFWKTCAARPQLLHRRVSRWWVSRLSRCCPPGSCKHRPAQDRMVVALSRARHAMYVMGCASLFRRNANKVCCLDLGDVNPPPNNNSQVVFLAALNY